MDIKFSVQNENRRKRHEKVISIIKGQTRLRNLTLYTISHVMRTKNSEIKIWNSKKNSGLEI